MAGFLGIQVVFAHLISTIRLPYIKYFTNFLCRDLLMSVMLHRSDWNSEKHMFWHWKDSLVCVCVGQWRAQSSDQCNTS